MVKRDVLAQRGPFGAIEFLRIWKRFLGEAHVAHMAACLGRQVVKERDCGFDAGVEGETVYRVQHFGCFGVDLLI
jgi:hypothetical protein